MCNINNITDWLMVIITAIYVGATIFICIFNGKSATAAQKQLSESALQQSENIKIQLAHKRLEIISFFDKLIAKIISDWDFEVSPHFDSYLMKNEIAIYFNDDFINFYTYLSEKIERLYRLLGDYDYAENHGECNGCGVRDIQLKIEQEKKGIDKYYKTVKNQIMKDYFGF